MHAGTTFHNEIETYAADLQSSLNALSLEHVRQVADLCASAYYDDCVIYTCGNGGSAATASHLAVDLSKATRYPGAAPVRALSLADQVPALTAWANDHSYDTVFSSQLEALGRPGDLLVVLSASGNSPNVLEALRQARKLAMRTVGLLGASGGQAAELCDVWVAAPAHDIEQQEDIHMSLAHMLTRCLRNAVAARCRESLAAEHAE
ncbi:SIS domain-containing protein (plasmid) [Streptomyces sp. NBC_00715]|uniref:D-sedoheptulose-7-phosphate isomerase n=1 Tax=Streptomyces sp. NBC_00715 TaxID=2975811 RepID=UPI00386ABC14